MEQPVDLIQGPAPRQPKGPHVSKTPSPTDPLIEVDRLSKTYRTTSGEPIVALDEVSFTIKQGEFVSIVGPSGCGKTTLLKILAGLIERSGGTVHMAGTPVSGPSREAGLVPQAATLLPWRTILRNVELPVDVQRLNRATHRQRARELLDMVGLADFADRYPSELSGGMQQRVAICRALVHDPALLLMDEPFGALDAMTREQMGLELQRIWSESHKSVIFVTHSIPEAVFLGDRVMVMAPRPGRLVEIIDIDVERPRRLEMLSHGQMGGYIDRIREHFQAKGRLD